MTCPACQGKITISECERGVRVYCNNSFCQSTLMHDGEWGKTEEDAYEHLIQQYELIEENAK